MSQLRDAAIEAMARAAAASTTGTNKAWDASPAIVKTTVLRENAAALDALLALLRDRPELVEVMARGIHTGRIAEHEGGWDDLDEWGRGCCRKDTVSALAALRDAFGERE